MVRKLFPIILIISIFLIIKSASAEENMVLKWNSLYKETVFSNRILKDSVYRLEKLHALMLVCLDQSYANNIYTTQEIEILLKTEKLNLKILSNFMSLIKDSTADIKSYGKTKGRRYAMLESRYSLIKFFYPNLLKELEEDNMKMLLEKNALVLGEWEEATVKVCDSNKSVKQKK